MENINFKQFIILSIFVFSLVGTICFAAPNFTLDNVSSVIDSIWRRLEFDRLGLDVTIYPENGEVDYLTSLSIVNMQSAYHRKGIEKLVLWTDKRDVGFQGTGVDQRVGEAVWDSESFTWYWDGLGLMVPESGLRIFVSAETERNMDDDRLVQFSIPVLDDNNENGVFDIGDKGAFFYSGYNGPETAVTNDSILAIRSGEIDYLGPKSVITNLFNGDEIILRDSFTISGFSKDQGRLSTKWAQVSVVETGSEEDWQDVTTDRSDYGRWFYDWSVPGTGSYELKLKSRDLGENESITDSITITVVDEGGIVSSEQSELSIDKEESLANGKIYINALVVIKDSDGNPLANKNVELCYVRADGYVAKNTQTTNESGILLWGVISKVAGEATLTAVADGVELSQHPVLLFVNE